MDRIAVPESWNANETMMNMRPDRTLYDKGRQIKSVDARPTGKTIKVKA